MAYGYEFYGSPLFWFGETSSFGPQFDMATWPRPAVGSQLGLATRTPLQQKLLPFACAKRDRDQYGRLKVVQHQWWLLSPINGGGEWKTSSINGGFSIAMSDYQSCNTFLHLWVWIFNMYVQHSRTNIFQIQFSGDPCEIIEPVGQVSCPSYGLPFTPK